jgi:putative copper resistance protein D
VWDAALIAVKTMTYAATLGAAGAAWFLRYCETLVASADRRKIRHIVFGAAALAMCAGGGQILVTAGSMSGEAAGLWDASLVPMVWQAGAGRDYMIRAAGLVAAALGVLPRRPIWPASLGALVAATSFAWSGHARAIHPQVLPIVLGAHLAGAAFWLGALAPLLIVASGTDAARLAAAAARFGAAALYVVAGLIAAGLILLATMLGGAAQLWSSAYGRYAMLKLVFVAALLCLAALNHLRLTPRLLAGDVGALRSLRMSVRFELLLGIFILAATAVLTTAASPPVLD